MNSDLRMMIVAAEGRYLVDAELDRVRGWAVGMPGRLEAARRLESRLDSITRAVADELSARDGRPEGSEAVFGRARIVAATRTTLAFVAMAVVRDDPKYFRDAFVDWYLHMLRNVVPKETLAHFSRRLRKAVLDELDGHELRAISPYFDAIDEAFAS
jgi:hypothetical protein